MTFAELSGYLDRLESTSSRNELVKTLAELYAKSSPDEIQPMTYLIQGRLVPFFEPVEIGLGEKLVIAAIAQAFGMANPEVARLFGRVGDLGQVAAQLAGQTPSPSLPVTAVHTSLMEIARPIPRPAPLTRATFPSSFVDLLTRRCSTRRRAQNARSRV